MELRPATPDDEPFLRALFAEVRGGMFAALPPEAAAHILEQQFGAQRAAYRAGFPDASHHIVEIDGTPAGRPIVDESRDAVVLVDISITADQRRHGLGTEIVGDLIARAAAGAATDAAGNTSLASTSTDNVVTYIAGDVTPGANDAPVITAPTAMTAELAELITFTGADSVAVTDPDALTGDLSLEVTIDVGDLAFASTTGMTVTGDSSGWTLVGTLPDLNAALATMTASVFDIGTSNDHDRRGRSGQHRRRGPHRHGHDHDHGG